MGGPRLKIGFLVLKLSFLKHYAGLVEHALARGIDATLLVDGTGDECAFGSYEFPHVAALPTFRGGRPAIRAYTTRDELALLVRSRRLDAVFVAAPVAVVDGVMRRPTVPFLRAACPGVLIAQLQSGPHPMLLAKFDMVDVVYGFAAQWVPWTAEYLVRRGHLAEADADDFAKRLEAVFVPAGFAEMEQLRYIDRATARARLGLPHDRPIVLHLPFPFLATRRAVWARWVYGGSRPVQWAGILASRRTQFLPYARHGWNDRRFARVLREFCDRNRALLVVKAREKDPVPRYLAERADRVFYDETYYPATILEIAAVADLCVHFYSTGLCEAVFAGAPNLCVSPTKTESPQQARRMVVEALSTSAPAFYNYPGVTYSWTVPEAMTKLAAARLADFALDPAARTRYLRRFFGFDDVDVAARIFADLERRLGTGPCCAR